MEVLNSRAIGETFALPVYRETHFDLIHGGLQP